MSLDTGENHLQGSPDCQGNKPGQAATPTPAPARLRALRPERWGRSSLSSLPLALTRGLEGRAKKFRTV